jgi:hypothetical protein
LQLARWLLRGEDAAMIWERAEEHASTRAGAHAVTPDDSHASARTDHQQSKRTS